MVKRLFWAWEYIDGPVLVLLYAGFVNATWEKEDPWRTLRFGWNLD